MYIRQVGRAVGGPSERFEAVEMDLEDGDEVVLDQLIERSLSENITFFHVIELQNIVSILHEEGTVEGVGADKVFTFVQKVLLSISEGVGLLAQLHHVHELDHALTFSHESSNSNRIPLVPKTEVNRPHVVRITQLGSVNVLRDEVCQQVTQSLNHVWLVFAQKLPSYLVGIRKDLLEIIYFVKPFQHVYPFHIFYSAFHCLLRDRVDDVLAHLRREVDLVVFL